MKLTRLHLQAFGPFTDRVLDFGSAGQSLVFVYGPNEAGKSATLRAISDLRFGIPPQSKDNFVHAHPDMRVGGVFLDRQGHEHCVVRRKGRGATLTFSADTSPADVPVPPEIEALITCSLSKEDYDSMFGLDHRRLRDGGEALLNGEGEVGAALFEASAGVRSIPAILDRLDQSARKFFMPGARGKNARINEALKAFDDQHDGYKKALVRPAHWVDLFKKHQIAAEEMAHLDQRRLDVNGRLLQIKELRAVAPLLSTLDQAAATLRELQEITLLSLAAPTDRAGAEAGLAAAEHSAGVASSDAGRHRARLEELKLDKAALEIGSSIERLTASAESIDAYQKDLSDARSEVTTETAHGAQLSAKIDYAANVNDVIKSAPTPTAKAGIEQLLHVVERAEQGLEQHQSAAARQGFDSVEATPPNMPSPEVRIALRSAQLEITRSDAILKRLAALPKEIKAAQRAITTALTELGLADEAALYRIRPMLDGEIDAAMSQLDKNTTRRQEFDKRIGEISTALDADIAQRDHLLSEGAVPTRDEVSAAREHRNTGWALVSATYIESTNPPVESFTNGKPLPQTYEEAVHRADHLVDELARDTDRAAQLQACLREITKLETDRDDLKSLLDQLGREEREQEVAWTRKLVDLNLPTMLPRALRDWQTLLAPARIACETLQSMVDEQAQALATEGALAATLRQAIVGTAMGSPSQDAPLSTLSALATEIEDDLKQRDKSLNTAAGKRLEREQQREQMVAREKELADDLQAAKDALKPVLTRLLLPGDDGVNVARARLGEFTALEAAQERLDTAVAKERRARDALGLLERQASAIAQALDDPVPIDLRLYVERLSARLKDAKTVETARTLAQQALDSALENQRTHEETASKHALILKNLCMSAGVDSPTLLPEAEEQSCRKREAQAEIDRSNAQLAQASRRPIAELRILLQDQDAARMDADEIALTQEFASLEDQLRAAREREETARRTLEAIGSADTAVAYREGMERAAAGVRSNMAPWIRSRLAHALLAEALKRFRDRAQGPMLSAASGYFERMTAGEFVRLISDDSESPPVLIAQRQNGERIHVDAMSEGTRDQLYLSLRLAALTLRRSAGVDLPVILDDVLMTSDDTRAGLMLQALADFSKGSQVMVFTHHEHLIDVARKNVREETLAVVIL